MARIQLNSGIGLNQLTPPAWLAQFLDSDDSLPGGARVDVAAFTAGDAVAVTVATGGAAQGATTIPITALPGPIASNVLFNGGIPAGTVLYFGGAKVATLTAAAVQGATSLTVAALPTALVAGDVASYNGTNRLFVPAGTLVSRTLSQRASGAGFHPWISGEEVPTAGECYLTLFDVVDARINADVALLMHAAIIKENFLPNWAVLGGTQQGIIRNLYQCILGIA